MSNKDTSQGMRQKIEFIKSLEVPLDFKLLCLQRLESYGKFAFGSSKALLPPPPVVKELTFESRFLLSEQKPD